jgi:hypothetical protein
VAAATMAAMRRRKLAIALAAFIVVVAAALLIVVPRRLPAAVRLLPEAEAYVYVDLRLLRRAGVLDGLPEVSREAEYEKFVRETGFQFERDLDEAAFAVHLPGFEGRPADAPARYSEIFVGSFDRDTAAAYFRKIAQAVETLEGVEVFHIAVEERTVRVAIVGRNMVAVSNAESAEPMRQMIENSRDRMRLPAGPELAREHYRRVPRASLAWAVSRAPRDARGAAYVWLPGGFEAPVPAESVLTASVRYVGVVQLRAEAVTPSEQAARRLVGNLNAYLAVFRAIGGEVQEEESAVLSARLSHAFLRKLAEPEEEVRELEE